MLKATDDPDEIWHIKRRISELSPLLAQVNELAECCEKYYEKGYYRNEKFTVTGLSRPKTSARCPDEEIDECDRKRTHTLAEGNCELIFF